MTVVDERELYVTVPSPAKLVRRIAIIALVLGAVTAVGIGVAVGPSSGFSSAVGTVIGIVNLWALAQLVVSLLDEKRAAGARGRAAVLLTLKALALVTVVGVLIMKNIVHGGSLMAGLSVVAVSIVLGALMPGDDEPSSPEQE